MTLPVSDVINVSISMATINSKASISPDGGDGAIVVGVSLHQIIKQMFASGEQGFFYDPNDLTTMFQDAAGTVPVTAVGQPVGLILDKSGRGNHARQTTSASRPILRKNATTGAYYLEFDGTDDFLVTSSINFTATDKISLFAGVRKLSDSARGILFELGSAVGTLPGSFGIEAPRLNTANAYSFVHQGSTSPGTLATSGSLYSAPHSAVLVGNGSLSGTLSESIKVNSITTVGPNTALGANTKYGNYPLYIGRRAGTSLPFNGHIYGLIGIGKLTTDSETTTMEKELAKRVGVTLNV